MTKVEFFSENPPLTLFEDWQIKNGLKKVLRPKDIAIKRHLNKLGFKKAKTILDFGCADGVWLERILKETEAHGIGVDIASGLISVANRRKNKRGVYYDSGKSWPIKPGSIDFCFSFDVFEHLRNRKTEIVKLSEIINKGGRLLIFTLNPNNKFTFDWLFEIFGSDWLYRRSDHLKSRFIAPGDLANELRSNGFKDIGFELYPGPCNLFIDVFCYGFLKSAESVVGSSAGWLLDLNDRFVKFIYHLNLKLDRPVINRGYSNGYFLWATKK